MNGYFDYAAATPIDPEVLAAMQPYFADVFYNPSAQYRLARDAKKAVESARSKVAEVLGSKPVEVIFTAGATEANNLAIHGIMRRFPDANMVVSAIEHESVLAPAQHYSHKVLPVDAGGIIRFEKLAELIDDKTVLVSAMLANNEIGTIQPIIQLARALEATRKQRLVAGNKLPLLLHCDGAQAGNYLDLHVHRLGLDLLSLNGGKLYGPKQSGALFLRSGVVLEPLIDGGGQERGLRSGTENVAAIVGFAEALSLAQAHRAEARESMQKLQAHFLEAIHAALPSVTINGSLKNRLPNNMHITLPGQDSERLVILLDEAGFSTASGSACSASSEEPSHVLAALGMPEADIRASLRFSMGKFTRQVDIDRLIAALKEVVA